MWVVSFTANTKHNRSRVKPNHTRKQPLISTSQAAILSTALQKVDVGRYSAEELKAMTWINASGQVS